MAVALVIARLARRPAQSAIKPRGLATGSIQGHYPAVTICSPSQDVGVVLRVVLFLVLFFVLIVAVVHFVRGRSSVQIFRAKTQTDSPNPSVALTLTLSILSQSPGSKCLCLPPALCLSQSIGFPPQ